MANTFSWEDDDGWRLLSKWFHSSCDISVSSLAFSDTQFTMKKGLITHLDPFLIRIEGDGKRFEMPLVTNVREWPSFTDVVSAELISETPQVKGSYPEMVTVESGDESWRFLASVQLEGKR